MTDIGSGTATAVGMVQERLAAVGVAVDDAQAGEVLATSREAEVAPLYRRLPIGDIEPMLSFDPRWRA
jgi:hypothetical protein